MPHFHPWRYLRDHHPDWTIIWAPLPAGLLGRTLHDLRVIVLDNGLTQAARRSTLAHELEHITRGPTPPVPALAAKEEAAIDRAVARRLIDIVRLGEALAWSRCRVEVADELWVDHDTLTARLHTLNDAERGYLHTRLEHLL